MTTGPASDRSPWEDACLAATILAVAPHAIGGLVLRARSGPVRDAWLALMRSLLPDPAKIRRVPLNVGDDRLIGGLDLPATLARGRPVAERGLLAEADGGVLIVPSAPAAGAEGGPGADDTSFAMRSPFAPALLRPFKSLRQPSLDLRLRD